MACRQCLVAIAADRHAKLDVLARDRRLGPDGRLRRQVPAGRFLYGRPDDRAGFCRALRSAGAFLVEDRALADGDRRRRRLFTAFFAGLGGSLVSISLCRFGRTAVRLGDRRDRRPLADGRHSTGRAFIDFAAVRHQPLRELFRLAIGRRLLGLRRRRLRFFGLGEVGNLLFLGRRLLGGSLVQLFGCLRAFRRSCLLFVLLRIRADKSRQVVAVHPHSVARARSHQQKDQRRDQARAAAGCAWLAALPRRHSNGVRRIGGFRRCIVLRRKIIGSRIDGG